VDEIERTYIINVITYLPDSHVGFAQCQIEFSNGLDLDTPPLLILLLILADDRTVAL
jgi:hypothetical protein